MGGAPVAGGGNRAWHEAAARSLGPGSTRVPVPPSFHGHDLEHWPLQHTLVFGALEAMVPSARAHLRQFLGQWGTAELGQDAAVVLSELVTNAIAASAALWPAEAPVLVWLGSDGDRVLVVVGDASPRPPMRLTLEPDAEGGRGLALVEALSSRWGWHPASIAGLLKVVWAEWRLPAGAGPLSVSVRDIRDRMDPPGAYTTVSKVTSILCDKDLLIRCLDDRAGKPGLPAWWYRAARPINEHIGELIARLMDYSPGPEAALAYALTARRKTSTGQPRDSTRTADA